MVSCPKSLRINSSIKWVERSQLKFQVNLLLRFQCPLLTKIVTENLEENVNIFVE